MIPIPIKKKLAEEFELCGFSVGENQDSRLMSVLESILKLQTEESTPLAFIEIYNQIQKDDPNTKLSKAWIHRVLKQLIETGLLRVDNPAARRKKYIADVNSIMNGFEKLKGKKIEELEEEKKRVQQKLDTITAIDCGHLSKEFVKGITGRQEEISSRIVRGVDELHRVLRFNMLEKAGEGDIIRATLLWAGPFLNETTKERMQRFIEAAERGAEVRYIVSTDAFQVIEKSELGGLLTSFQEMVKSILELKTKGKLFDARLYSGPKTYNQVSFNDESMALIIAENPVTATWITREFNPDLIDNARITFDKEWERAQSVLNLTAEDFKALGIAPEGLIRKILPSK